MTARLRSTLALAVLPAAFLLLTSLLRRSAPYLPVTHDPEYFYLLNGLATATGHFPQSHFHPGVQLQVLGGVLIRFLHAWQGSGPIVDDVLLHSETYLYPMQTVVLSAQVILIFATGFGVARWLGSLGLAVFAQAAWLLIPDLWLHSAAYSPEPLQILFAGALALTVLAAAGRESPSVGLAALAGFLLGAGVMNKVSFFPLAFLLLAFRFHEERGIAVLAAISSAFFFLALLGPSSRHFFPYFIQFATHQGPWGTGEAGLLPALSSLWGGFQVLRTEGPFFGHTIPPLLFLAGFCLFGPLDPRARRFPLAATVCSLAGFMLVLRQPESRYLLPFLAVQPLAFAAWLASLRGPSRAVGMAAVLAMFFLSVGAGLASPSFRLLLEHRHYEAGAGASVMSEALRKREEVIARDPRCGVLVAVEGVISTPFALRAGNAVAGGLFTKRLEELFPRTYFEESADANGPRLRRFEFEGVSSAELERLFRSWGCLFHLRGAKERALPFPAREEILGEFGGSWVVRATPR